VYNAEQKMEFITASYPDGAMRVEVMELFAGFAPYEESWGSDLVKQPINLLQPAFDTIIESISASKAERVLLPALRKYRKWYLDRNPKAICAGILLLKLNLDSKLRNTMVASPMHLKRVLDKVFDAPERESLDCVYRALLWMAFAGVPRDQATSITVDEVDLYSLQIHHDGKDYDIYREGLAEFHKLCELDYFMYIHRNPDYEQRRPRLNGTQLLRGYGVSSLDIVKIGKDMSKWFSKTKWSLVYESVQACGLYYRKFELERIGEAVSFDEETAQRISELPEADESTIKSNFYSIRGRYRNGYNQWKNFFNVAAEDDD